MYNILGGVGVPVEGARRLSLLLSISSFNDLHPALASVIEWRLSFEISLLNHPEFSRSEL